MHLSCNVASHEHYSDVRLNPVQQTNPPYLSFPQNYADSSHNWRVYDISGKKLMLKHARIFFSQQVYRMKQLLMLREFFFLPDVRMFDLGSFPPRVPLAHQQSVLGSD